MAPRIAELASIISANTAKIDDHLTANGFNEISFDENAGDVLSGPGLAAARQAVLEATDELHALMLGPAGILTTPSVSARLKAFANPDGFAQGRSETDSGSIIS